MNEYGQYPLVVDLDGTLTKTDTLVESVFLLIKKYPLYFFMLPFWLLKGRAFFKSSIASHVSIDPHCLPYNQDLLEYLKLEKSNGRKIYLATAAHISIAGRVSDYFDFFEGVFATEKDENLKGTNKLIKIQNELGDDFSYAGDSEADIKIWEKAQSAILVGASDKVTEIATKSTSIEKEICIEKVTLKTWVKACRIHQWLKNSLIFVPLLTAFSFTDTDKVLSSLIAFLAFSLIASATYILNDLWDLPSDRVHPSKKYRPFAAATVPVLHGVFATALLLLLGLLLGLVVSDGFFIMLLIYLVMTVSYSLIFKEYVLIDVIFLSLLFTIRILSGSVAIEIATSTWLLSFSVFIFFSLALVKRCSELVSLRSREISASSGRDYQVSDLVILWPLGVGAALSAVVVFGLFINAPETQAKYATPELLWLASIGFIYWLSRLWVKTARGEMHDDPIIYAIKNKGSFITVTMIIIVILTAHFFTISI